MNREITNNKEDYYHLKYGFSLYTIRNIWAMSKSADELNRNFEAAVSLSKTLSKVYPNSEVSK